MQFARKWENSPSSMLLRQVTLIFIHISDAPIPILEISRVLKRVLEINRALIPILELKLIYDIVQLILLDHISIII